MCPCLALFLFVCFPINTEIKSLPGQNAHVKFVRGKEVKGEGLGSGAGGPVTQKAAEKGDTAAALGHGCSATAPQSIGGNTCKPASSKCPE